MSLAAKQRLVVAVLALLALWPLAHRTLVAQARVDPWRFFGWAMYCTPKLPVMVQLIAEIGRARLPLVAETLPRPTRRAVQTLGRQRALWGTFARADAVAARILADRPDLDAIEIVLRHWYLDPATGLIGEARFKYRYPRAAAAAAGA